MLAEYRHRRDQLCAWLAEEPRFRFVTPAGAFYLFIDVSAFLSPDGIRTSAELATVAPGRRARGGHAGRGVRRARLPAAVVRDVARRAGTRDRKDHRLPARDGKPDERRRRLGRACSIPAFSRSSKRPSVLPTSVPTTPVAQIYGTDALKRGHPADVVVFPGTTLDVAAVVRVCAAHREPIVPRGGGSGYTGGSVPVRGGVVLSLERMNRILEIDRSTSLAVVEPNVDHG